MHSASRTRILHTQAHRPSFTDPADAPSRSGDRNGMSRSMWNRMKPSQFQDIDDLRDRSVDRGCHHPVTPGSENELVTSTRLMLANSHYRAGELDEAIKHYRILVDSIDEKRSWFRLKVFRNLGLAMWRKGDYRASLANFQRDCSPDSCYMAFLCAIALGDVQSFKTELNRLVQNAQDTHQHLIATSCGILIKSQTVDVDWVLSHCGPSVHDLVRAQLTLQRIIEGAISSAELLTESKRLEAFPANEIYLGQPRDGLRDQFNECELVNSAVSLPPTHIAEKAELYTQASSLSIRCWQARFNLGLLVAQNPSRGEEALRLLSSIPDNPHAVFQRALLLETKLNRLPEALRLYTALVASDRFRNDPDLLGRIARLHERLGGNGQTYLSEARTVDPSFDFSNVE